MESGGMNCLKYTMFAFNLLFTICGLGVVAVGVMVLVGQSEILTLMKHAQVDAAHVSTVQEAFSGADQSQMAVYCIIGAGAALALVSMLGCFGAVTENRSLLIFYFCILLLTFLMEAAAGILGFYFFDQVRFYVGKYVGTAVLELYGQSDKQTLTKAIDQVNQKLECCGFLSPNDWNNHTIIDGVPYSCCKYQNGTDCSGNPELIYDEGCFDALVAWIQEKIIYVAVFGIVVAVLQIFGMAISICLCKAWGDDEVFYA